MAARFIGMIAGAVVALLWAASPAQAHTYTFDITGFIDTGDSLIMQGSTLQWHHTGSGAAVGRHGGNNFPTVITSTLDGVTQMNAVDWTPDWPDPVPNEIRFDAFSSSFNTLLPSLPTIGALSVSTSVISGRGALTVTQFPSESDNGDTTIILFTDGANGSANLDGLITITQVPEPASLGLLAVGAVGLLSRRRKC